MIKQVPAHIEVYDPRMANLVDAEADLVCVDDSSHHTEGPVYIPADDSVVWSDVKGDRVLRWHPNKVSILREKSHFQNGNALDLNGRLVACSHGDRAIVYQGETGQWHTLVNCYLGKRFNSPNDLIVKSDGTIWFTDPPFGLTQTEEGCGGEQEQPGSFVFRYDPNTGEITQAIIDMIRPNGLAFSPDERLLYVSDTSAYEDPELYHHIRVYKITRGRWAQQGKTFAIVESGQPDGLCVDAQGNVFAATQEGIQVYAPEGSYLGKIHVPEGCANVTFGGKQNNRLFITAGKSLYFIDLKTQGFNRSLTTKGET